MVTDRININASALELEMKWLYRVLETRMKLYFDHDCEVKDVLDITPPEHGTDGSMLSDFLGYYKFNQVERIIFALSLAPHIKPQLLDVFFTVNSTYQRCFTEFGSKNGHSYGGFLPTGETAMFVLAGDDINKKIAFRYIFDADHIFNAHNILKLDSTNSIEPEMNGHLNLSREIIDLITTGNVRKPAFSLDFPAKLIETKQDWNDLILDADTMEQILEIKAWIQYGDVLLNELELSKKIKPGFRSLFHGPPGTGKTFTAALLGKDTGLDVYRIDLSMIISKYIGETEKNLEKIFSRAENKNWILFFDEADALFGKRTNISDAHDRFANQEVSYLLQRVEDFNGVVILASNLKANIDEAFMRRLQSVIHFPMPTAYERLQIWQNAFSTKTVLEDKISLQNIAAEFELSGGAIMNIVRYSTLMMLKKKKHVIELLDIKNGIQKEFRKEGKTS